jgi:hypothetical protein
MAQRRTTKLVNITLSTQTGGELSRVLREVDDPQDVGATVIEWLLNDNVILSVGDSISIDEIEG